MVKTSRKSIEQQTVLNQIKYMSKKGWSIKKIKGKLKLTTSKHKLPNNKV